MSRHRSAFTLVELLVVISIIALLIAMLLPVLGQARETARLAQCSSNERQQAMAFNTYAAEWKGFPPVVVLPGGNTALWMTQIAPYLNTEIPPATWPPTVIKVLQCPSTFGKVAIWADQSYSPNYFFSQQRDNDQYQVSAAAWWATQLLDGPNRLDDPRLLGRQSELILTGESVSYDWLIPSWNAVHLYDVLHLKRRTFSFVDGHVDASGPEKNYILARLNNGGFLFGRNNHPGSGEP